MLLFIGVAVEGPVKVVLNNPTSLYLRCRNEVSWQCVADIVSGIRGSNGPKQIIVWPEDAVHLRLVDFLRHASNDLLGFFAADLAEFLKILGNEVAVPAQVGGPTVVLGLDAALHDTEARRVRELFAEGADGFGLRVALDAHLLTGLTHPPHRIEEVDANQLFFAARLTLISGGEVGAL